MFLCKDMLWGLFSGNAAAARRGSRALVKVCSIYAWLIFTPSAGNFDVGRGGARGGVTDKRKRNRGRHLSGRCRRSALPTTSYRECARARHWGRSADMSRSAGLTLGGILLLGGAGAVHADDLSASDSLSAMTIAPAMYGVFSQVPENWSDLPVQFHLKESVGYNSNILNTPFTKSGSVTRALRPTYRQSDLNLEL